MMRSSRISVESMESVGIKNERIRNVLIRKDTTRAATTMMTASRRNTPSMRPTERLESATSFDLVHPRALLSHSHVTIVSVGGVPERGA